MPKIYVYSSFTKQEKIKHFLYVSFLPCKSFCLYVNICFLFHIFRTISAISPVFLIQKAH